MNDFPIYIFQIGAKNYISTFILEHMSHGSKTLPLKLLEVLPGLHDTTVTCWILQLVIFTNVTLTSRTKFPFQNLMKSVA